MNKKISFVDVWGGIPMYPSLSIAYLSTIAKQEGYSTKIISPNIIKDFNEDVFRKYLEIDKPDYAAFTLFTTQVFNAYRLIKVAKMLGCITIVGGPHVSSLGGEEVKKECPEIDYLFEKESEMTFREFLKRNIKEKIIKMDKFSDINSIPFPDRIAYRDNGWQFDSNYLKKPVHILISSRGCPFSCLTGDTIINTLEGDIPIKNLTDKKKIILYTYDKNTEKVFLTEGVHCRKTGINKQLVRVLFDDGTHIDCTPEHKFLVFKNGNQHQRIIRWEVEAKDLQFKMRLHTLRFNNKCAGGYTEISWGRRKRRKLHQLVAEFKLGRKLTKEEEIHHIDKNHKNNSINNIEILTHKDHVLRHLGEKNPMYRKDVIYQKTKNRIINHKVVSVTKIGKSDVYNLEVPSTNWFFANNVLVHNCNFCYKDTFGRKYRQRSVDNVLDECEEIMKAGGKELYFIDDLFVFDKQWLREFCEKKKKRKINLPFKCLGRIDRLDEEMIILLKKSGCHTIAIGIESGNQAVIDWIDKKLNLEEVSACCDLLHKHKINIESYFIIGHRIDNEETINETIEFAKKINTDFPRFFLFSPYPGSRVWNELPVILKEKYWLNGIENDLRASSPLSICKVSPERLVELWHKAHDEAYSFKYTQNIIREFFDKPFNRIWFYKLKAWVGYGVFKLHKRRFK